MVLTADQQRVKSLLTETVTLLCKNGLHFQTEFSIEGLIGITLDSQDVFLVSIKETIRAPGHSVTQTNCEDDESVSHRKHGGTHSISHQTRRPKMFEISAANKRRPFVGYRQPMNMQSNFRNSRQNWSLTQNKVGQFNAEAAGTLSDSSRFVNDVKWESSSKHQHNDEHSGEQEDSSNQMPVPPHSLGSDKEQSYTKHWNNVVSLEHLNEAGSAGSGEQEPLRKRRRSTDTVITDSAEMNCSVNLVGGTDTTGGSGDERDVVDHDKINPENQKYHDASERSTENNYNNDGLVNDLIKIKEEVGNDDEEGRTASRFDDYMAYLAMCGVQPDSHSYQGLESSIASSSHSYYTSSASTNSTGIHERSRHTWGSGPRSVERGRSTFTSNSDKTKLTSSQVELVSGSGVYVDKMSFHWLEMDLRPKGSKLVRRLVHEIWPDEHVLAMSSCLGQGTSNKGLDQHKVDAIKAYVQYRIPDMSHSKIILAINECCRDARSKLRRWKAGHLDVGHLSAQTSAGPLAL